MKELAARADTKSADSDKLFAHVREELEIHMVRLYVAIVGRSRGETSTSSVVTESVNAANAVVQHLGYDA